MIWEFYALLFVLALASMLLGIAKKHIAPLILACILFASLGITAHNIEYISGGVTLNWEEPIFIYLNWLLLFVSFIFALAGSVSTLKEGKDADKGYRT